MAAIFQIRRGTNEDKPSLAEGELYVDQSSENLIIGISGSKEITLLKLNDINTGSLHLTGDIRLSGSIYLGNETADNISALGVFTTNLVPSGNSTKDVGTSGSYWRNLYATNISGAIAATNGVISGSSQLDTAFEQIASATHTLVSGSSQIIGILDSLNSFSGSQLEKDSALATISGSLILTASANTISISNLNSFTQSQLTQNSTLASYTASVETRFTEIGVVSGSLILTASSHQTSITSLNGWSASAKIELSNLESKSASVDTSLSEINSYTSSLKAAIALSGNDVTINGDLTVNGTTTQINSTQVNIGENILELNFGGSATDAGIYTKDATGASLVSGSILWDSTTDYWKAGKKDLESKVLLAGGDNVISSSLQLTELNSFTASANGRLNNLESTSASVNTSVGNLNIVSASVNVFTSSASNRLGNLESKSASIDVNVLNINTFTSSQLTQNSTLGTYTASVEGRLSTLGTYTASVETRLTQIGVVSGSLILTASNHEQRIDELETKSASVDINIVNIHTFTASINSKFSNLETYTASINTDLTSIHQTTASLNSWTASTSQSIWDLYSSSINHEGRIDYIEGVAFGGLDLNAQFSTIGQVTSSLQSFTASADSRLNNLELTSQSINSWSSSLTNTFATDAEVAAGYEAQGRGIISGSSQLSGTTIANLTITNLTTVNQTSSVVFSSGSNIFGDFGNDVHQFTGSVQITGSQTVIGSIAATSFSGVINATNGVISSSAQINSIFEEKASATHTLISSSVQILGGSGIVSASSQITYSGISSIPIGIVSGSSQITPLLPVGVVSGSSQIGGLSNAQLSNSSISIAGTSVSLGGSITAVSILNGTNVISSSTQIVSVLPTGVVSGSSQIDLTSTTNYVSGVLTRLNAVGVVSGSSQISLGSASGNIALASQTTGDYVASLVQGTGVTITNNSGENTTPTIAIGQSVGTSADVQFNSIGVGTTASTTAGEIRAIGDITAFYSSDARLKENVVPIPNALEKVNQISGNTYDWKDGYDSIHSHKGSDVGVIAQEIEQILPQIVTNRDNGYKAVQYEKMIPLLIEAIKELSAKVDRLENK